ncbi:hypothetical protein SPAR_27166 [Streptomyces sparsogenes DSM 40356]|uniref:Uncharacterized protein n=1 Tax=Streptomyces sparsogenes DSM 40356 TaxID=1331668 RepID=A0A1R1SD77_9ACTN|nr:hypothetical protein SPAR_27166 [Streptomyces sparsogenes DSM 40356]
MEPAQRGAGVGAQLVGQPPPDVLVPIQRVRDPPAAVQGGDELAHHPLVQRMPLRPSGQLGQQLGVVAVAQPDVGEAQLGGEPLLVHGGAQRVEPGGVHGGEGVPAPQPEGLLQERGGVLVPLRGAGLGHQVAEAVQVHRRGIGAEQVSAGLPGDAHLLGGGRQGPAQPGDAAVQRVQGALRWPVGPHPVDQLLRRHHPVGVHQQRRQHAPLARVPQVLDEQSVDTRLDGAQQSEIDRHGQPLPCVPGSCLPAVVCGFKVSRRIPQGGPGTVVSVRGKGGAHGRPHGRGITTPGGRGRG